MHNWIKPIEYEHCSECGISKRLAGKINNTICNPKKAAGEKSNSTQLLCTMPTELTAENGAKAALTGEFQFTIQSSQNISVTVPWTTIKAIYKEAAKLLGTQLRY